MKNISQDTIEKYFHTKYDFKKRYNPKVYLVDDNIDDLKIGCLSLRESDNISDVCPISSPDQLFQELEETGLYETIEYSDKNAPIIILDLHMPAMDGIEVLQRIRNHPITADFAVILLSTDQTGYKMRDAYELNASGYLSKPFKLEEFHTVLQNIKKNKGYS